MNDQNSDNAENKAAQLNSHCIEILDTIKAVHGEAVAHAVYIVGQQDRASTVAAILLARSVGQGAVNPTSCAKALHALHESYMDAFMLNLKLTGISDDARVDVIKTTGKLFERQRKSISESMGVPS